MSCAGLFIFKSGQLKAGSSKLHLELCMACIGHCKQIWCVWTVADAMEMESQPWRFLIQLLAQGLFIGEWILAFFFKCLRLCFFVVFSFSSITFKFTFFFLFIFFISTDWDAEFGPLFNSFFLFLKLSVVSLHKLVYI